MVQTTFSKQIGIEVPLICGAMYPCSNPELVAAASEAGGIGIVQPLSLTYVHGYDFREGLRKIRSLTKKPIGLNLLIEASSKKYLERNQKWFQIALEEGVRFFISALGNPRWFVERGRSYDAIFYHDVTERKWALKAIEAGVDGLICVNNRAGGHAGTKTPADLLNELQDLGKPLICAGGIGDAEDYRKALQLGYAGCQLGTRFIASRECSAHDDYKSAIIQANEEDIVLSEKITGVPVSIINTEYVRSVGTKPGPILRRLLQDPRTKHYVRMFYGLRSLLQFKRSLEQGSRYKEYFQAGKSVAGIDRIETVGDIIRRFAT